MQTIFALSSAPGRAGVAVIRVSGVLAHRSVELLTGKGPPASRITSLRAFRDPRDGTELDRGLLLWFAGPGSFTGEDVAEFHIHGGRSVVAGMLAALGRIEGLRLAEAGEFTRRAFENGKLDLTEAEGLADLIDAETEMQRRQALRQMEGRLGLLCEDWRGRMIRILAYAEAEIDFPDEDVPDNLIRHLGPEVNSLNREITSHLDDGRRGELLREGVEIAIIGPPNAGKSSLLNRLAGRDAAIVSEEAGTTRDVLEVRLDLGGVPVTLADTAGLREAANAIEREGIRRALARAEAADLCLVVGVAGEDNAHFANARPDDILILNKSDCSEASRPLDGAIRLSALTGEGIEALTELLTEKLGYLTGVGAHPLITRARHREGFAECLASLQRVQSGLLEDGLPELIAEDLRLAARALGRITGRVDVEDLLDVVFRDFCIGK